MNTEIIIITDVSRSMFGLANDASAGLDAFIQEQRKTPGEARVTSVIFAARHLLQFAAKPIEEVEKFSLQIGGITAMLDAIGSTLESQGKRIAQEKWADAVVVVITTDGEENASREYTVGRIKEMITHAESKGWKFIFMAANQDAFLSGAALGISAQSTRNVAPTGAGVRDSYTYASSMTNLYRANQTI